MNETGFRCPKCGNKDNFTASAVVVIGETRISTDGWDYWSNGGHVELYERAFLHCEECGFSAHHEEFEEK